MTYKQLQYIIMLITYITCLMRCIYLTNSFFCTIICTLQLDKNFINVTYRYVCRFCRISIRQAKKHYYFHNLMCNLLQLDSLIKYFKHKRRIQMAFRGSFFRLFLYTILFNNFFTKY